MRKYEETFEAILGPPRPPAPDLEDTIEKTPPPSDGEPTLREAVEEWTRSSTSGVFLLPTYISDLVLRNLSLAEQSVLVRLIRLGGGLGRPTPRTRQVEIARACGLRPALVGAVIRSLAEKGLVARSRRNPLTRSARYRVELPPTLEKTLRVCSVCHELIDEEEESWLPAPLSLRPDGSYQYVSAHAGCIEGATL